MAGLGGPGPGWHCQSCSPSVSSARSTAHLLAGTWLLGWNSPLQLCPCSLLMLPDVLGLVWRAHRPWPHNSHGRVTLSRENVEALRHSPSCWCDATDTEQTGTLPGCDGCPAAPRTCSGEAPAGISEWGVHFGVCALAINTVQMSQAQQCCGRHRRGPALAPPISSMALGGGVVVLPGLHGEVAVARWLCCWRRTLGRTHAPWPWRGATMGGHPGTP